MSPTNSTVSTPPPDATPSPGFADELRAVWDNLPHKGWLGLLLGSWIVLFQFLGNSTFGYIDTPSLFRWLLYAYEERVDDQHGYWIPLVVLGLLWWKRNDWAPVTKQTSWFPVILLGVALLLHVIGFAVQQTRVSVLAFCFGFYALTGVVWGNAWLRATLFPFLLLVFCVPLGNSSQFITFPLRMLVTTLSVGFSDVVLGLDVAREGSLIFSADHKYQYDVAPACSGIRSLVTLTALTLVYAFMFFEKAWKRLIILALAAPLAILGNTTRIIIVIMTADAFGETAGARIEQWLGLLTFAVAIVGLLLAGRWLKEDRNPGDAASVSETKAAEVGP